jgi:hypothetical protein
LIQRFDVRAFVEGSRDFEVILGVVLERRRVDDGAVRNRREFAVFLRTDRDFLPRIGPYFARPVTLAMPSTRRISFPM